MSDRVSYYKVECPDALEKISAFFEKRENVYEKVRALCERYGFEHHVTHDSIQHGVWFWNMSADPNMEQIDKTIWKTSTHSKSGFLNILPRATAKKHKAEYDSMLPKRLDYKELNEIILKDGVVPWSKAYGYKWRKGELFMFETSLPVSSVAIEILGSEYCKDIEGDDHE